MSFYKISNFWLSSSTTMISMGKFWVSDIIYPQNPNALLVFSKSWNASKSSTTKQAIFTLAIFFFFLLLCSMSLDFLLIHFVRETFQQKKITHYGNNSFTSLGYPELYYCNRFPVPCLFLSNMPFPLTKVLTFWRKKIEKRTIGPSYIRLDYFVS